MSAFLVGLMVVATAAFVGYPLVTNAHKPRAAGPVPSAGEGSTGYLSSDELEIDYESGKIEKATYEKVLSEQQGVDTLDLELEREIARRRKAIARAPAAGPAAKGQAERCSRCGTPYESGDRFCAKCGGALEQPKPGKCAACGASVEDEDAFCARCGARLK